MLQTKVGMCWFKNRVTKPTPCQLFLLHIWYIHNYIYVSHLCVHLMKLQSLLLTAPMVTYMHHICTSVGPEIFAIDSSQSYMFLSPIQTVTKILQQTPVQRNQTSILHGETLLMLLYHFTLMAHLKNTYTHKHTNIHTHSHTHKHTNTYTHTQTYKHIHTQTYKHTHTHAHKHTNTYTHTRIHINTHKHAHTNTHTS